MGQVELWICDNCGKEERGSVGMMWQELGYASNSAKSDGFQPAILCSLECVAKYAEKMTGSGRYWSAPAITQ